MIMAMVAAVLAVFTFGMVTVFPGSIKLRLVERVSMDDAQMGKTVTVWQITTLVLTLFVGPLLDRVGHKLILIFGFIVVALAMWLFATVKHAAGVFVASALLGTGGSGVNSGGNTLLPALNTSNPLAASNLGNVFFGLGAFVVPFLASSLFTRFSYRSTVSVFDDVSLVAVLPAAFGAYPAVASSDDGSVFADVRHQFARTVYRPGAYRSFFENKVYSGRLHLDGRARVAFGCFGIPL